MVTRHSFRTRIIKAFCGLGLILSLFYAVFVYIGIEYLEDYLETNLYQQRIKDELNLFLKQYRQNHNTALPRSRLLSIYMSQSAMPEAFRQLVKDRPDGFYEDDNIENGKEYQYHFVIYTIPETQQTLYLFYDTGIFEVNKQRMPAIVLILSAGLLFVFLISIWLGIATSRKVIAPVAELSDLIKNTDPDHLPTDLSKFYDHDEVGTLASAIEQAMQRIQLFNQRKQQFTRNASHELRTPVTIIKGAVELLKQNAGAENLWIWNPVLRIERSVFDMEDIIDSFLWLAREKDVLKTDKKCNGSELINEAVSQHRHLIENKSLALEITTESDLWINAPRSLVKIVFNNLVKNAFHYTMNGKIKIIIKTDRIVIENSGIGIPLDILNNATEPYVRGKESRGFGIGLTIVKMIGERFGWQLDIRSQQENGTIAQLIVS